MKEIKLKKLRNLSIRFLQFAIFIRYAKSKVSLLPITELIYFTECLTLLICKESAQPVHRALAKIRGCLYNFIKPKLIWKGRRKWGDTSRAWCMQALILQFLNLEFRELPT